ncbi:thiolase family protein [Caulobacter mirabilis]|uniref:Thiolase n=1 Tax=Caulobacter mirabilis TaxID=69666 RepID=A0A2D2B407_9CAUL|nr:thiolase family protein [Caulobacter mirabilis]ATQ44977.1 thiolase [Caulobacter mirabilis]
MRDDDVYIIGTGRTPFSSDRSASVKALAQSAIETALSDAGVSRAEVQAAYFANAGQGALGGQHMIRGQIALRHAGFEHIPVVNVENACASATTALTQAVALIRAGEADVALAAGAERLATGDRPNEKLFFAGATDVLAAESDGFVAEQDRSVFMDIYASLARDYMERYGATREAFAAVASKNLAHAVHNPNAQRRQALTLGEVLAAREVVWPLTLPMCAPIGNGAAAAVICRGDVLKRFPAASPLRIAAAVLGTGTLDPAQARQDPITKRLARSAYERAGVDPRDVHVAEVHDATAAGEIIQIEALGLVPEGEGGRATLAGETRLGGRIPVNVSGGLEANGHPIGATGLAQVHEIADQLRGRAGARQVERASIGVVENGGGFLGAEEAVASVILIERASL